MSTDNLKTCRLLTAAQTAEILGLKERTIRAWIASGRLKALRIGVNVRVPAEIVEQLIEAAKTTAGDEEPATSTALSA